MAAKNGIKSERYEPIPYASEQGIFCGLAGNLNQAIREISALIRESALVRYLDRPIRSSREISNLAEKAKEGRRQMLA